MFDMVDTAFSCGRALIVCEFLQETSKVKKVVCMKSEMQICSVVLLGGAKYNRFKELQSQYIVSLMR